MKRFSQEWISIAATATLLLLLAGNAGAEEVDSVARHETGTAQHDIQSPVVPESSTWAGSLVIVIIGMFVAGAVIGPIVRANMPQDVPLSSHDEPPGASHHHGASGTLLDDQSHRHSHGH